MKVSVFGNPDLKEDKLVVEMVPELKKRFPKIEFKVEDPSEGLRPPEDGLWVILDVAKGVDGVKVFEDVNKLVVEKRVSIHDYDVAMEIKLLEKLGRIRKLKIVVVPMGYSKQKTLKELELIFKSLV